MKISSLINYLVKIKDKYGDVRICITREYEEPYGIVTKYIDSAKSSDINNVIYYKDGYLIIDNMN